MVKKEILAKAEKVVEFNSNNGWGFGGSFGKEYQYDNRRVSLAIGERCYRHSGTSKYCRVYADGALVLEERCFNAKVEAKMNELLCGKQ